MCSKYIKTTIHIYIYIYIYIYSLNKRTGHKPAAKGPKAAVNKEY